MRIAQVGTFDLDNLGDLLFPWVFSKIVKKIAKEKEKDVEIVLFSPKGNKAGDIYSDQLESFPLELFDKEDSRKRFDKIFIGGGDIIRSDDWSLGSVYGELGPMLSFSQILSPTVSPARRLVLLSPGAPFPISDGARIFLKNSFLRIAHAAVRDTSTRRLIEALCPDDIQISVLPDIVNDIANHLTHAEVTERSQRILKDFIPDSRPYICFQGHKDVVGSVQNASDLLRKIQADLGLPIVLLEIGRCLGDSEFLSSLGSECNFPLISLRDKSSLNMLDKVSIIANSSGFVGSSLHGNIIASAYGKPHISFVGSMSNKTKGFFMQCKTGLLYNSICDAIENVSAINSFLGPKKNYPIEFLKGKAIEDYIGKCLFSEKRIWRIC